MRVLQSYCKFTKDFISAVTRHRMGHLNFLVITHWHPWEKAFLAYFVLMTVRFRLRPQLSNSIPLPETDYPKIERSVAQNSPWKLAAAQSQVTINFPQEIPFLRPESKTGVPVRKVECQTEIYACSGILNLTTGRCLRGLTRRLPKKCVNKVKNVCGSTEMTEHFNSLFQF